MMYVAGGNSRFSRAQTAAMIDDSYIPARGRRGYSDRGHEPRLDTCYSQCAGRCEREGRPMAQLDPSRSFENFTVIFLGQ
jgi:hypothetical protein